MRGEKTKILEGKAALCKAFSGKEIKFLIGFPFDPTSNSSATGHDKKRFLSSIINMNKFFAADEVLLANELWDFLSGESGTMELLLKIINTISTKEFLQHIDFINDKSNIEKNLNGYRQIVTEWNLFSELCLLNNLSAIKCNLESNKKYIRVYSQLIFDEGEYNENRFKALSKFM